MFCFKYYLMLLIFTSYFLCQIPNEKLYITIQMMDQVGTDLFSTE